MQNRYSGDIGDFGKFGLLRQLCAHGVSVGVNWYLTPDEDHNGDGRHIGYLQQDRFRACDELLWQSLRRIVFDGRRAVSALESAELLKAVFFSDVLDFSGLTASERETARAEWHRKALRSLSGQAIIFVDPDNGLIVPSAKGTRKSNKYVLRRELRDYYQNNASVIYYQHKARRCDAAYMEQHRDLAQCGDFPGAKAVGLKFKTTSQRYYFFLMQPQHAGLISASIQQMLAGPWGEHFEFCSIDN